MAPASTSSEGSVLLDAAAPRSDERMIDAPPLQFKLDSVEDANTELVLYEISTSSDPTVSGAFEEGTTSFEVPQPVKLLLDAIRHAEANYQRLRSHAKDNGVAIEKAFHTLVEYQHKVEAHKVEMTHLVQSQTKWTDSYIQGVHQDVLRFASSFETANHMLGNDVATLKTLASATHSRLETHEQAIVKVHDESQQTKALQASLAKLIQEEREKDRAEAARQRVADRDARLASERALVEQFSKMDERMKSLERLALLEPLDYDTESLREFFLPDIESHGQKARSKKKGKEPASQAALPPATATRPRHERHISSTGLTDTLNDLRVESESGRRNDRPVDAGGHQSSRQRRNTHVAMAPRIEEVDETPGQPMVPAGDGGAGQRGDGGDGGRRPPKPPLISGPPSDPESSSSSSDEGHPGRNERSSRPPSREPRTSRPLNHPEDRGLERLKRKQRREREEYLRSRGALAGNPNDPDSSGSDDDGSRHGRRTPRGPKGPVPPLIDRMGERPPAVSTLFIQKPKMAEPEKFKGSIKHFDVWWKTLQNYLAFYEMELLRDEDRIRMVSGFLREEAQRWAQVRQEQMSEEGVADTWATWSNAIQRHFANPHDSLDAETEMQGLKYNHNIRDFMVKLKTLNLKVQLRGPSLRNLVERCMTEEILKILGTKGTAEDDDQFLEQVTDAGLTMERIARRTKTLNAQGKGGNSGGGGQKKTAAAGGAPAKKGNADQRDPNKLAEYVKKHTGIEREIVLARRKADQCTRCGKAGHRWAACRAQQPNTKSVAAGGKKRKASDNDGDEEGDPQPAKKAKKTVSAARAERPLPEVLYSDDTDMELDF